MTTKTCIHVNCRSNNNDECTETNCNYLNRAVYKWYSNVDTQKYQTEEAYLNATQ